MSIPLVAVIGAGRADATLRAHALDVGAAIARSGYGLVCGGLGGVMEAACEGACQELGRGSGRIVGLLPGTDPADANPWVDVAVPTGVGLARNVMVVLAASAVVAVGGESGTLSEIAHAWQLGRPLCAYTPAQGWAARLAGERIDNKRADHIAVAEGVAELERWLRSAIRPAEGTVGIG